MVNWAADVSDLSTHSAEKPVSKPETAQITLEEARAIQAFAWPDVWADSLRLTVDSNTFSMAGREFQKAIIRDESRVIVMPKGAQLGFTTLILLKTLHSLIKRGWSVLYLLPLKSGSVKFVQTRIDPTIDSNKTIAAEFKRVDNRSEKVTMSGARFYIRGTNIHSELREAPADLLVLDERDVANEEFLGDAYARLDGSKVQRIYSLSTPTVDGHGVYGDNGWYDSDQMEWWVPCPHCGSKQILTFEDNVLPNLGDTISECVDSCRCVHCHKTFSDDHRALANADGVWVPSNPGAEIRGYRVSQLNSPTKELAHPMFGMLRDWFAGQTDSLRMKDFMTLGLGLPYAAPGDRFSVELLDRSRSEYVFGGIASGQLCIGVDQGHDVLHVTIYSAEGRRMRLVRTLLVTGDGTRKKWQVLDEDVLQAYTDWVCVCDAHPDKEDCEELSRKYSGRFFMGYEKDRPDQKETAKFEKAVYGEPARVNIDRSMAFDQYIKRFIEGNILLPRDARELGEHMPGKSYGGFYHQHLQMTRVLQAAVGTNTNLVTRWVNGTVVGKKGTTKSGNRPDHWHHSGMFAMVAGMQDAPLVVSESAGELFRRSGNVVARFAA